MKKINNFFKLISIIGVSKIYSIFLVFLMLFSSILDILSLGLIAPYISTIFDIEQTKTDVADVFGIECGAQLSGMVGLHALD